MNNEDNYSVNTLGSVKDLSVSTVYTYFYQSTEGKFRHTEKRRNKMCDR